jgi:hypothetical protein
MILDRWPKVVSDKILSFNHPQAIAAHPNLKTIKILPSKSSSSVSIREICGQTLHDSGHFSLV